MIAWPNVDKVHVCVSSLRAALIRMVLTRDGRCQRPCGPLPKYHTRVTADATMKCVTLSYRVAGRAAQADGHGSAPLRWLGEPARAAARGQTLAHGADSQRGRPYRSTWVDS